MSAINVSIEVNPRRGRRRERQVEVLLEWPPLPTWAVALEDARDLHRDLGRVLEAVPRLAPSVERWSATPGCMPPTATFEPWLEPPGVRTSALADTAPSGLPGAAGSRPSGPPGPVGTHDVSSGPPEPDDPPVFDDVASAGSGPVGPSAADDVASAGSGPVGPSAGDDGASAGSG